METKTFQKLRQTLFTILIDENSAHSCKKPINIFIILLIFANLLAVVLESVPELKNNFSSSFYYFEIFSVAFFTIEYLLRLWACVERNPFDSDFIYRIKFAITPLSLIDLMAIAPFYLSTFFVYDLRFLRVLRLLRILRVLKLARYSKSIALIIKVLGNKKEELTVTLTALIALLVVASCLTFFAEHDAQPDVFSSIPQTLWWGVITLTTIGYGDIYPVTLLGRIFTGIVATLGVGIFALPAGILASGFTEEVKSAKKEICPHCNKEI